MRAKIDNEVLLIHQDDLPQYKKTGSVVRNSYFWALKSIAGRCPFGSNWEYEAEVWFAVQRMLLSFSESGYLGLSETILEFPHGTEVPTVLRSVSSWISEEEWNVEKEPEESLSRFGKKEFGKKEFGKREFGKKDRDGDDRKEKRASSWRR
ncbi:hypothetical protein [Leptolyngbya ohadii]|uniref:hypothetical protein n=1 Tax=Leptolyngbya ohadii TaxID=1962290 RepID=UPI0034E2A004